MCLWQFRMRGETHREGERWLRIIRGGERERVVFVNAYMHISFDVEINIASDESN